MTTHKSITLKFDVFVSLASYGRNLNPKRTASSQKNNSTASPKPWLRN